MLRSLVLFLFAGSLLLPVPTQARSPAVERDELPEPEDGGYPERKKEEPVEQEEEQKEERESGDRSEDDHDAAWMDDIVLSVFVHVAPTEGFDSRQRVVFTKGLVDELSKLQETNVSTEAPVTSSDEEPACPEEQTSCLTRLAESLGAEEIVMARAVDLDGAKVLTLKRVRIRDASIMGAVTRQMSGSQGEEFLLILGDAVAELFPDRPLVTGEIRGADPALVDRFNPPTVAKWQFYTVATATVVAAGTAVALGLAARSAEKDYNDYAAMGQTQVIEGSTLQRKGEAADDRALYSTVVWGITGALAIGTGLLFFSTDWDGDEILHAGFVPTDGGFTLGFGGGF